MPFLFILLNRVVKYIPKSLFIREMKLKINNNIAYLENLMPEERELLGLRQKKTYPLKITG
jgi:hypothetical protein